MLRKGLLKYVPINITEGTYEANFFLDFSQILKIKNHKKS